MPVASRADEPGAGRFVDGPWTRNPVLDDDERLAMVPLGAVGVARIRLLRLTKVQR